jgi:hypothetical protein
MLDYLEGKVSDRKLRLCACACARRWWETLKHYRASREAIERAERFADDQASAAELEEARQRADTWAMNAGQFEQYAALAAAATTADLAMDAARNAQENGRLQAVREAAHEVIPEEDEQAVNEQASAAELRAQAELLREVIGNPFRPVPIDPNWLALANGSAGAVAQVICANSQFADLPLLADALEDAGCAEEALLRHLRGPGPHARGCWVLDLLTGRG